MCASLHGATIVKKGEKFAGTRATPMCIDQTSLSRALAFLGDAPLFAIRPMRNAKMAILVTCTEVFNGLIEDKFSPAAWAACTSFTSSPT